LSVEEREAIPAKQHPIFREVDAAFHAHLEVVTANRQRGDGQVEQERARGQGGARPEQEERGRTRARLPG
jgi:hypothetical protein